MGRPGGNPNLRSKKGRSGRKTISEEALKIVKERTYKEIMAELLPDKLLAEKHLELLTVPKKVRKFVKGDLLDEYEEVDSQAISKGLDMAYKIKGEYVADKRGDKDNPIEVKHIIVGMEIKKDN